MITRQNTNRAWDCMQDEWQAIRDNNCVDADNIEYHAQQLINAYVAALFNLNTQASYNSCYYQLDNLINDLAVTVRVANHRGYSHTSYKRSKHCNTGVALYDQCMQDEPNRYIISIEVLRDRDRRGILMRTTTDSEDNITRIELVNINSISLLEESLSYIDSELNDLF